MTKRPSWKQRNIRYGKHSRQFGGTRGEGVGYVVDDVEVDKETEDSLLKEDDKEAFMETEEYKVW